LPLQVLNHVLFISLIIEDLAGRLLESVVISTVDPTRLVVWHPDWFPSGCTTLFNLGSVSSNISFWVLSEQGRSVLIMLRTVNFLIILKVVVLLGLLPLLVLAIIDRREFKLLLNDFMCRRLACMIAGFLYWLLYWFIVSVILWCPVATASHLVAYAMTPERNSVTLRE